MHYLQNRIKYNEQFADIIYRVYKQMRYGINGCGKPQEDINLISIRRELSEWEVYNDENVEFSVIDSDNDGGFNDGIEGEECCSKLAEILEQNQNMSNRKYGVVPAGDIDGINRTFIIPDIPVEDTVCVYYNSTRVANSLFTVNGNVITLLFTPQPPTDTLLVDYDVLKTT